MTESQNRNPKEKGQDQTGHTSDQAQQMAQQAQEKAGEVAQQAQQQATSLATTQKTKASQSLEQVSKALRQAGQQLEQQGQTMPGQVLTTAAQQFDHVAGYLDTHTVKQMVGEVEAFGRRRPTVFLGGSLAGGFLLSRFLKSSPLRDQTAGSGGNVTP